MFLQTIINEKLKKQEEQDLLEQMGQTLGADMTGTKPRNFTSKIGSIKNGKVNYPKDQNFFHSSDIPEQI